MRPFCTLMLAVLALALAAPQAAAQNWGRVEGRVTVAGTDSPLPGATVLVAGTNFGTASDAEGRYTLRLPTGRYVLRTSAVGFTARRDTVTVEQDATTRLDVALEEDVIEMEGVTVEDRSAPQEAGVYTLTPETIQHIPAPFNDGFRALKVLPGVATNNELSAQYSVRGGGYNENLIFINGFEVYMPFRPRQGEQEGLGLLNPALAEQITLYTGGFPARYGGKLSSALEVDYRRPDGESLSGSAALSLLDASVAAGASGLDGRLGWTFGLRKARADRLFGTQELKGDYAPDFTDIQATLAYRLGGGHEVEALGIWADHVFELAPSSRRTYYGIVSLNPLFASNLKAQYTEYDGQRRDGYTTRFGGVRLTSRLSPRLRFEHDVAFFQTEEREQFDVSGQSVLSSVDPFSGEVTPESFGTQHDTADNRVRVSTLTGRGRYHFTARRHAAEAGWHVRSLRFVDRLDERVAFTSRYGDETLVIDALEARATFDAWQAGLYVQDALDLLPERDRLLLTAGVRADFFSFNDEWTVSPRLQARFALSERTTLLGSWGLYHQKPTYREFRGRPQPNDTTLLRVNRDLQAQRSVQLVLGGEHFLPEKRLYLRAEVYYKHLTNLISYDVENVRVLYSGYNDARGFTYGLDLQLRGEFVPGLESWFNYSYLVSRERFLPAFQTVFNEGLVPRPADQRHTFSAFVQDYVPGDKTWKLHLRALFGSGLPYTPPVPGEEVSATITLQQPGPRNSGRLPAYRRIDLGATKLIPLFEDGFGRPVTLSLTAELLNVFDMTNTVAYAWDGRFNRIPTRLTPRTLNARLLLEF